MTISVAAMQKVVGSAMPSEHKADFLIKANYKQNMLQDVKKYITANIGMFPHFEFATRRLGIANSSASLGIVETKTQTQIDAVRDMQLPESMKQKLIFFFDNFIDGLSFHKFKNGQTNDYVTDKEKNMHKMLIKGYDYGLDWDKVHNSAYTEVQDTNNPSIKYRYQDNKKIEQNIEDMSRSRHRDVTVAHLRRNDPIYGKQASVVSNNEPGIYVDLETSTGEFISKIFDKAMQKFRKEDLRNGTEDLFNFFKGSLGIQNQTAYPVLHKLTVACMRQIMEHGHAYQMANVMKQQKGEEMVK